MKMISGFFSLILVVGIGGLFFLQSPNGKPWLSTGDFVPDIDGAMSAVKSNLKRASETVAPGETGNIYRWQDDQGVWQFSDTPPEPSVEVEQLTINPDRNVIQGLVAEQPEPVAAAPEPASNNLPLPTTIPLGEIPKLIEDAKNLQKLMDQRQEQLVTE